jgi:hypothetical protein
MGYPQPRAQRSTLVGTLSYSRRSRSTCTRIWQHAHASLVTQTPVMPCLAHPFTDCSRPQRFPPLIAPLTRPPPPRRFFSGESPTSPTCSFTGACTTLFPLLSE